MSRIFAGVAALALLGAAWLLLREEEVESAGPLSTDAAREAPELATGARAKPIDTPSAVESVDAAWLLAELESKDVQRQSAAFTKAAPAAVTYDDALAAFLVSKLTAGGLLAHWSRVLLGKLGPAAAKHVTPLFTSPDPNARREAMFVAVIWKWNDGGSVRPPVLDLLQDDDESVRRVTWNYVSTGVPYDAELAEFLISEIEPINGVAFNGPELALARMGPEGIAHLLRMMDDPSEELLLNALGGLAGAPVPDLRRVVHRLRPYIRTEDETIAAAAIEVLTPLEGDVTDVLPALVAALENESVVVVEAALMVLEQMGARAAPAAPTVVELLDHGHEGIATRAADVLGAFRTEGERVMPALARAAKDDVSEAAAIALAGFGPPALEHALRAFDEADDDGRFALLLTFQRLGPDAAPAAVSRLITLIEGDDYDLRRRATATLGAIGPAADVAVPAIAKRAHDRASTLPLAVTLGALTRMGTRGEASVRAWLRSAEPHVQGRLVEVLATSHGHTGFALAELEALAAKAWYPVRRNAMQAAVVSLSDPARPGRFAPNPDPALVARVRAILERGLRDENAQNRGYAKKALAELNAAQNG